MVVISAPAVDKIYEPFTHNPLTRYQVKPTFPSFMGTHKECIADGN